MSVFQEMEEFFKDRYKGWSGADQFVGTGDRLGRMVDELCWPPEEIEKGLKGCFNAVFPDPYDEMLVVGPTDVWTLCPHHLVPCNFQVHIGYIPNGRVLGLSKFSRVALLLGKKPIIQEAYSRELADILWTSLKPEGLGVWVVGTHGCMSVRGVKQKASVSTSILRGSFLEDPKVREEFFSIVRGRQ